MPTAAAPEPEDQHGSTLFADPSILDELEAVESWERDEHEAAHGEPLVDPRVARLIREKFVEATDAPKLDVRDWPSAVGFPEQFVEGNVEAPAHRVRQLRFNDGRIVYEAWTPVHKSVETADELRAASMGRMPIGGWKLTYHVFSPQWCDCPTATLETVEHTDGSRHMMHPDCGRERKSKVEGSMGDHVLGINFGPPDDYVNGFYPTLPGDDVVHYNHGKKGMDAHRDGRKLGNPTVEGGFLRGGKEITGGRAEHRRLTKGMTHLGPGYTRDVEKIQADKEAKKKANLRLKVEKAMQLAPRKPFEV